MKKIILISIILFIAFNIFSESGYIYFNLGLNAYKSGIYDKAIEYWFKSSDLYLKAGQKSKASAGK
jgi:hypothetical protein